ITDLLMRVLIIPSWYFPQGSNEIGGRMFHQLAVGLKEKGIDARILFAEFSLQGPLTKEITVSKESGIPTRRISQWFPPKASSLLLKMWIRKYVAAVLQYIKKEGKPDILHAQSYMAGMVCAAVYRKTKIPFVLTERVSSFITGKIPDRHVPFIKDCFNSAIGITCVSPGLKSYLTKYTNKPIEVIPNFYDQSVFYHDLVIEKYKRFTWLSVGEPAYVKGLDILLKAYANVKQQLQNVEMQLILIDRIRGKQDLIELSQQLNIENDITWAGLISQAQVAGMMRQSHVLISASRTETFGKTIMEAQACGLPVIATKTDGASYIINSTDQGELIELNDVDALANAMVEMYQKYNSYKPAYIISAVESRFKEDIVISEWINFYNKILE
ncbi:MAG: glycosyltransferase, partial [Saprospiraceae bacterium]